jgi:hypothetical protein
MVAPYPDTDARDVKELRADLEREVVALVPALSRPPRDGEFGNAFYELALRMAAQVTSRLNKTAQRDALAFFDALDIPPMAPRAAEAPLVFTLAEKKDEPVIVPKGTQVGAATDKDEVIFETLHGLTVTPARLEHLAAVDAGADTIEEAPANVRSTEPPPGPFPTYRLATFADVGSTTIQVTPAVGLEAGDLIRIGTDGQVYRVETMQGDLCTIDPKLVTPADPETTEIEVEKVTRFDAFTLRDVQAHQVYVGHSELLNLEQRAQITLMIEPPSVMRRLGEMGISAALWGTPDIGQTVGGQALALTADGKPKPDWYALDFASADANGVTFVKSWTGKVEKFEVEGNKSLWLRLVLDEKIPNTAETGTRVNTLKLKIESIADTPDPNLIEGSETIARAFYNNAPLSIGTRFLPFGPQPQRFDTFAIAAPEALSKKGATVTLDVRLIDATIATLTMAAAASGPPRAFAVGKNGRPQAMAFLQGGIQWQEIPGPQTLPASWQSAGGTPDLLLDASNALQAIQLDSGTATPLDLLIAQDRNGRLWSTTVFKALSPQGFAAANWNLLWPPLPTGFDPIVCSLALKSSGGNLFVLILTRNDAFRLDLTPTTGALTVPGTALPNTFGIPTLGDKMALVPVQDTTWPALPVSAAPEVVLIDDFGTLWTAPIDPLVNSILWTQIVSASSATPNVRPAASRGTYGFVIAAAEMNPNSKLFAVYHPPALSPNFPISTFSVLAGTSILALPHNVDVGAHQPPITAIGDQAGSHAIVLWTDNARADLTPLPAGSLPSSAPQGIWVPGDNPNSDPPQFILAGESETLLTAQLTREKQTVSVTLHDALRLAPSTPLPNYVELNPTGTPQLLPVSLPDLASVTESVFSMPLGTLTASTTQYRFFQVTNPFNSPGPVNSGTNQFPLDASDTGSTGDTDASVNKFLKIGGQVYEVQSIVPTTGTTRVATVMPVLASGTTSYETMNILLTRTAAAVDIATLVELPAAFNMSDVALLSLPGGVPAPQPVVAQNNPWLLLGSAWTTVPSGTQAVIEQKFTFANLSTQALRGYQNPYLAWRYSDGKVWKELVLTADGTFQLAKSGDIQFVVPDDLSQTEIGGQNDYYVSASLIGGTYGSANYVVTATTVGSTTTQTITVDNSNLHPPEIFSIEASFELGEAVASELVLVENNGAVLNQTQAAAEAQASFELFEGLLALDPKLEPRSIFLGFGKRFDVNPLTLYIDSDEQDGEDALQAAVLTQKGQQAWSAVSVEDETAAFRRSGFVRISTPVPPVRASLFGRDLYWLRLAPKSAADWKPRLKGLYVNAVAAGQAKTVTQEILGSSAGEPNQAYSLSETPVILREAAGVVREGVAAPLDVELRVRESSLSEEERDVLNATLSRGDIKGVENPPDIPGDWVLWQRVDSFVGRDGDARIFSLDPATGTVTFGDGRQGKIPPAGRDAIRAFRYQQGGGKQGNVAAYAIKSLKTALESVDAVTNPVEATGGIDAPGVEQLIATAPTRLRNANRALSGADMEALAVSSSPDVVRARYIMPRDAKDKMHLAVAVRTGQPCPRPSIARRKALAKYIIEHAAGMLESDDLDVIPPEYAPVTVTVDLLASSADVMSEVERAAREKLAAFLDPIDGGPDGKGWPFGRRIWPSDIYRIVSAIPGVDRITDVTITPDSGVNLDRLSAAALICAAENGLKVNVETGGMT